MQATNRVNGARYSGEVLCAILTVEMSSDWEKEKRKWLVTEWVKKLWKNKQWQKGEKNEWQGKKVKKSMWERKIKLKEIRSQQDRM